MLSVKIMVLCFVALGVIAASGARAANPVVVIDTSMGAIKVELLEDKAPVTVKNFLDYMGKKHYDGTIFHRVIDGFMAQCGGFEPGMKEKRAGNPIKNEAGNGLSNLRGTLAMARTSDPDSATAQFFISVKDNTFLDRSGDTPRQAGYAVFGRVIDGMEVVDKIKAVRTGNKGGHDDVPVDDITIKSITLEKK